MMLYDNKHYTYLYKNVIIRTVWMGVTIAAP